MMRSIIFPFRKIKKADTVQYATFSTRCFAMTVDMLLIYIVTSPLIFPLSEILFPDLRMSYMTGFVQNIANNILTGQISYSEALQLVIEEGVLTRMLFDNMMQVVVAAVVVIWFWYKYNTTPALALFGIEIVDADTGGTPTLKQYVIRYIGVIIGMIPLMLGMLWMIFDSRKQAWHDKMANTLVLKKKSWLFGKPYTS